jgi:DNA-binding PadR family transcriptional regulator
MPRPPRESARLLPLPSAELHILLALLDAERHGYAIKQEVAERTAGEVQLGPGTLYGAIKRMLASGTIEESGRRPAADEDDERRRYYRITPFGRAVAAAEARRLEQLVALARRKRLLGRLRPA